MGSYEQGNFSLGYIDPSDVKAKNLKQMKDWFYQSNYTQQSASWMQAAIDKRFKAGDQNLYNALYGSTNNYQQSYRFFFNLIRRHRDMIEGFQRKNRKSTITLPVHENDDQLADDYNKCLKWSEDRDGYQEYQSQSFGAAIDTGMSLLHLYPDYTLDPISGDLFTDSVQSPNFLIDSFFRKQDLTDCNGLWRRRWVSKVEAKNLLKGYYKEIDKMKSGGMRDGRFPLQAELQNANVNNLMTYDEFYYRTTRAGIIVLDPKTGEAVEWEQDDSDESDLMERTLAQQPWLQVKEVQIPTVKLCISIGNQEVYDGPNLLNIDQYPFAVSLCHYEPDMQNPVLRCMGVIRNMRDPQFLYNMRKCIELEILQSQINSGWIYPVDAVVDAKAFRQTGNGFLVPLKAGRQPNEIQRIEPAAIPQSLLELSASLAEDITKISGVNEELLGSATDDKAGILAVLRQGAGLVTLQTIFDRNDYTQRIFGGIRLQAIRKNFSKGKVRNILGKDPDPRFFTSHSQKYSVALEEGNYSTTQRQMELQQLLHFKEIGMPIANKSIIRAAFISNKKQVIEDMEAEVQQQQQAQQAEMQQAQQVDQAKMMESMSKAQMNKAKEQELLASTQEKLANVGQIHAKSEHEMMESDYKLVQMMMELEDMQFNQFKNAFEYAQAVKVANQPQQQEALV